MRTDINRFVHSTRRPLAVLLVATGLALILAAPLAQANQKTSDKDHWGEWHALGDGYVARRRQPAKLDQPKTERRHAMVQDRLDRLLALEADLQTELGEASGKKARKLHRQAAKLKNRIARASTHHKRLESGRGDRKNSLWLHTGAEGLYSVSIADLAAKLGKNERLLRRKLKHGALVLATGEDLDSESAERRVSWYFDKRTDSLLFVGEAYETFYSTQNAYQLRFGGEKTRQAGAMKVINGAVSAVGSTTPFSETLKFEEEPDLLFSTWTVASEPDADYWFWDYLYGGYKDSIDVKLNIPDPSDTGTAQLRVTLRGWTERYEGNEHEVFAELNGAPVGSSVIWDGFQQAVLVADFDQSLLDSTGNNTLILRNSYAAGTHPGEWLDQIEVDYLRQPVAKNGKLWMHDVAEGSQTVTGFTGADILLLESPDGIAVLRKDVRIEADGAGGWSATFAAAGGVDYLLIERPATAIATVTAGNRPHLKKANNVADYLIIAPREFSATAKALAAYRGSRYSRVKIAWLDDIYNEFSAGREDPFAIARFMARVTSAWRSSPTSVVLIGKGSLDQRDRMAYGDSFLPVVMTSTPWALAASDSRLLGFEDNAPFAIGRLPITNDAEGVAYIDKLIAYESTTPGPERFEAVLVADNPDDAGDFYANSDQLASRLLGTLGFTRVTKLYHPIVDVGAGLADSATWDTGYLSYDGHGSVSRIGDYREKFMDSTIASVLTNANYPIFTALTCAVGDDTLPGTRSLASALVLNPTGGAIASVAPTGLSLDADAQILGNALVDSLFGASNTIGQAVSDAKVETSGYISDFMPRMYSVIGEPGVYAR